MAQDTNKGGAFNPIPETDRSRLIGARRHAQSPSRDKSERERANTLGGIQLQLYVHGEIPGYHLYWENDENGAIEQLLMAGFDFVTQDELNAKQAKIVPDLDITSCISRYIKGMRADGQPLRAYLMKCPDEIWNERENARYAAADQRDHDIYEQAVNPNTRAGFRKPNGVETHMDTQYRKEYGVGPVRR